MHRSREWLFERIRRAQREQGLSGRELATQFKVSRNTVKQALESPVPPERKSPPPRKSVLEPVKGFIDAMLREDLDAPAKQRHTIVRIMERLAAEHDFELARQTTVWDYVSKRRPQIRAEALEGRALAPAQRHLPPSSQRRGRVLSLVRFDGPVMLPRFHGLDVEVGPYRAPGRTTSPPSNPQRRRAPSESPNRRVRTRCTS